MAFIEEAHVGDVGTIFRVTVYDTTSSGGSTVADISGATVKQFTFKSIFEIRFHISQKKI